VNTGFAQWLGATGTSPNGTANGCFTVRSDEEFDKPAQTIFVTESGSDGLVNQPYFTAGYWENKGPLDSAGRGRSGYPSTRERPLRHSGGANYVFADGHAKWHALGQIYLPPTPGGLFPSLAHARCNLAKYFAVTKTERDFRGNAAVAGGYACDW
jgi:prepilin-type processing-associated H-X9-DG protein